MMKVKCYILSVSMLFAMLAGCDRQENRVLDCKKSFSQECEWELSSVQARANPIVQASLAGEGCRQGNDKACEVLSSIFADNRRLRSDSYVLTSVPLDENSFALQVGKFFSTLPGLKCSESSPGWHACQDFLHAFGETFSYFTQAGEQSILQGLSVQDQFADRRAWTKTSAANAENSGQGWYGTSRIINCSTQQGQSWRCQTVDPVISHSKSDAGAYQDNGANADNPTLFSGVFALSQVLCEQKSDCVALTQSLLTQGLDQPTIEAYRPKKTYFSDQSSLFQTKGNATNLSSTTSTSLPVMIEQRQDYNTSSAKFSSASVTDPESIRAKIHVANPLILPMDTLVAGFCRNQNFCQDALDSLLMGEGEEAELFSSEQQKELETATKPKVTTSNQSTPTNSQVDVQAESPKFLSFQEQVGQQEKLTAFQIAQRLGQQEAELDQEKGEQLRAIIEQSRQKNAVITAGEKNRLLKEGLYSGAQSAQLSLEKKIAYQDSVQAGGMDEAKYLGEIKLAKFQKGIVEGATAAQIVQNKLSYFQRGLVSGKAAGRLEREKQMAFVAGERDGFVKEQAILAEENKKINPSSAPSSAPSQHSSAINAAVYPANSNSQASQEISVNKKVVPRSPKDWSNQDTASAFMPLLQVLDDVPSASKTQCGNGNLRACYQLAELYARGGEGIRKNTILADNIVEQLCKVSTSGNQEGQFYCAKAQLNKLAIPAVVSPQGKLPLQMMKDSCQSGFKEACQFLREQETAN